ncbi:MAG: glycosyltransferase family 4 protein [Candidatus Schekmanbacteria bacterium]|nr:glycosyltransferase family 4 protein [Candidatus Schekmanbacteria bacterium]
MEDKSKRDRRIVKITHIISAGGVGGGERQLLIFAKGFARDRYELGFIVPERGALSSKLEALGFKPEVIDINRSLLSIPVMHKLIKYLMETRPDIVHTHGARANFYGRIAASLAGVPFSVSTIHNSISDYPVSSFKKRIYITAEKLTVRKAAKIVTVSNYLKNELVSEYGISSKKIITIYPAIDEIALQVTDDRFATRKKLGVNDSELLISQMGRMTPQKGFHYFIEAAGLLSKKHGNLKWLFVGDGPLRGELEALCSKKGISERCIFTGFREDVGNLISASDIFVSSSLSEGFPITLIEASYMGKPVVATRVSGVPEFIEDSVNGILVKPQNSEALALAIERLIVSSFLREQLGNSAKQSVSEKFSAEYMIGKFSDLYETLLLKHTMISSF